MTYRKLNLDRDKIDHCRNLAERIVAPVARYIERHSTASIERASLRIMGVWDAHGDTPHANLIIDSLSRDQLRRGAAWWFAKAKVHTGLETKVLSRKLAAREIKFDGIPDIPADKIKNAAAKLSEDGIAKIDEAARVRIRRQNSAANNCPPLKYVILAASDADTARTEAAWAIECGADVISFAGSTKEPLMDYVPDGIATAGTRDFFKSQAGFKLLRKILDDSAAASGRYARLAGFSDDLSMPEITVVAALEGMDILLDDPMHGILCKDINMKRAFVDQHFSRALCAKTGTVISIGGESFPLINDAYRDAHLVLVGLFINEQLAQRAGVSPEMIGFGHAFDIDPSTEDGFLYELAHAQMMREIFPRSPIKYMPPKRYMTGNLMQGNVMNAMFNVSAIITEQTMGLLGVPTWDALNSSLQNRYLALKNASYIFRNMKHIGDEITFVPNGKIARRAHTVLENVHKHLRKIETCGLMQAISKGMFGDAGPGEDGGAGLEGVFQKDREYFNPVIDILKGTKPFDFAQGMA